ncbi:hypothetical protein [Mucilaginibacter jinjuensis]|uniref:Uncharacterized protein n=1 Tax=Mucilaginibacter jinjuensis TaxID=1176721 RepID=A0ABY7T9K8_9SPHI|nr:hypothetical protein [Mucilaginibacter jinjuensis]WCT12428.1 hypothetical protein PQO05_00595 [Mucilaginibacter jinjuensis]
MRRSFKYLSPVLVTGLIIFSVAFGIRQTCGGKCLHIKYNAAPAGYSIYKDMLRFFIPVIKS